MQFDICRSPISLTSPNALNHWDQMVLAFLAHGSQAPVHLKNLLDAAPDFAMAHAAKSLFSMMMGRRELVEVAAAASADAQRYLLAGGATRREHLWCEAAAAWINGRPTVAINRLEEAMQRNPADTLTLKVVHAIRFILGDNFGMRHSVEAVIDAHGMDHPLRGYALGCHAFALEETGCYDEAERVGLDALHFATDDAWGLHAVAHVYDMTHRPRAGIAVIESNGCAWGHCNNFRFHVWWHKALLHLDEGEYDVVLNLYDEKIRAEKTDDYRDFSNASSLLMRLELEGVDVGDRWTELADLAETRSDDGCLVFADLHYMLALIGDDRDDAAARMTSRIARDAGGLGEMAAVTRDPGQAAAQGLTAFGEARFGEAFQMLNAARPRFQVMGGSHAQRDVFERLTIEAAIRAGQLDEAERLLGERIGLRSGHVDAFAHRRMELVQNARTVMPALAVH